MELKQYIRLFRKWAWLIGLAALVGGSLAFFARRGQADIYQAQTKILIGNFIASPNPEPLDIGTGAELAKTYTELAHMRPILLGTIDALGLDMSPSSLRGSFTAESIEETSIIVITVQHGDPELAAAIANEVANQIIKKSPTNLTPQQQETIDASRDQIAQLNTQIGAARAQLKTISEQLATAEEENQLLRLQTQYNVTADMINQLTATVAEFQSIISNLQRRTNSLDIVESAIVPQFPLAKGVIQTAILGAVIGVILSSALVLFVNYQETTVKSVEQVSEMLSLPVLGVISRFGRARDNYDKRLITRDAPTSPVAETYHALKTNLLFSSDSDGHIQRKNVYVITSPGQNEGKSITTANLAVSMALAGSRVLLIDADLRQPTLHKIFNMENTGNLSALLTTSPAEMGLSVEGDHTGDDIPEQLASHLHTTDVPNLLVMPAGELPAIPSEVLYSETLVDWIQVFYSYLGAEFIVFDTPPCLAVSDSAVLAANVRAKVVMVLEAGQTRRQSAINAKTQFAHTGNAVFGIVLNKANPYDQEFGVGGYGY
ncbi:MAG: hypothetical protein JXQ72_10920 [Anaerolineae bacterium]|nr:hypothetical protein [Anaerolineae bacterium]